MLRCQYVAQASLSTYVVCLRYVNFYLAATVYGLPDILAQTAKLKLLSFSFLVHQQGPQVPYQKRIKGNGTILICPIAVFLRGRGRRLRMDGTRNIRVPPPLYETLLSQVQPRTFKAWHAFTCGRAWVPGSIVPYFKLLYHCYIVHTTMYLPSLRRWKSKSWTRVESQPGS